MPSKDIYSDVDYSPKKSKDRSFYTEQIDKSFFINCLIENGFKETISNTFNDGEVLIRILSDSCDIAILDDFEYWEYDKLNNFKIPIPVTEYEFEEFLKTVDILLSN